jgi:hypothetical protein
MKKTLLLSAIFALISFLSENLIAADLQKLDEFLSDADVWNIEAGKFQDGKDGPYAKWLSDKEKNAARYPGYSNSPKITIFDSKIEEAIFKFKDGKLSNIEVSIYNRGDAGAAISISDFQKRMSDTAAKITTWSGDKGTQLDKQKLANGMCIEKKAWVKDSKTAIVLLWSITDKKKSETPEYLKLEISPFDPKHDPRKKSMIDSSKNNDIKSTANLAGLKKNVQKDEKGNVSINGIPMVDQGQKGYCAVAVVERVLRYYGSEVDQHVIAQLAGTKAGTDPDAMYDALKKAGTKLGIKIKEIVSIDVGGIVKMLTKYNAMAKKEKKSQVAFGNMIDVPDCYNQMDIDVLKRYKLDKEKNDYNKFKKEIFSSVDEGVPLVWGMILGKIQEPATPQMNGGHMRLIKGYNKTGNQIIYSDTWGAEHDWKTMNIDDAWAVTTGLYIIEPRTRK